MKQRINRRAYLQATAAMTPSQRVEKAWELSNQVKAATKNAIREVFPEKTEEQIHQLFLERLWRFRSRNY